MLMVIMIEKHLWRHCQTGRDEYDTVQLVVVVYATNVVGNSVQQLKRCQKDIAVITDIQKQTRAYT